MTAAIKASRDLEPLLQPIFAQAPAGESLRYEGTYDRIREARREELELSQGVWQKEPKRADWAKVEELCLVALEKKTKDLQIALWLCEAWLMLDGLEGATDGLALIAQLHERYWETMYPEASDLEYRLSQIEWLKEKFAERLFFLPISAPIDEVVTPKITYADWEAAQFQEQRANRASAQGAAQAKEGKLNAALCQQSLNSTPAEFFSELWEKLSACAAIGRTLDQTLDAHYGDASPGLSKLIHVLEAIASVIAPFVHQLQELPEPGAEELSPGGEHASVDMYVPRNSIRSRSEAYACLAEVAEYLGRTEPHSPVPYLLRRAIAWGSMELDELLPELLANEGALHDVTKLLQIPYPKR